MLATLLAVLFCLLLAPAHAEFLPGVTGTAFQVYKVETRNNEGGWDAWGQIVVIGDANIAAEASSSPNSTQSWDAASTYWFQTSDTVCNTAFPANGTTFRIKKSASQSTSCNASGGEPSKDFPTTSSTFSAAQDYPLLNGSWYKIKYDNAVIGYAHQNNGQGEVRRLRFFLNTAQTPLVAPYYSAQRNSIDLSSGFMYFNPATKPNSLSGIGTLDLTQ